MKVKLHNIEADYSEGYALVTWKGKQYEFNLSNIKFDEYCEETLENAVVFEGGYAEHYYERQVYSSIEEVVEDEGEEAIVQYLLEDIEEEEFLTFANILED